MLGEQKVPVLAERGDHAAEPPGDRSLVFDDQPCSFGTPHGPVVSVPDTLEIDDITIIMPRHHTSEAPFRRGIEQFERLYAESETVTRIMAISRHAYIAGVPHRIAYLEILHDDIRDRTNVMMWTGEQSLDWFKSVRPPEGGDWRRA